MENKLYSDLVRIEDNYFNIYNYRLKLKKHIELEKIENYEYSFPTIIDNDIYGVLVSAIDWQAPGYFLVFRLEKDKINYLQRYYILNNEDNSLGYLNSHLCKYIGNNHLYLYSIFKAPLATTGIVNNVIQEQKDGKVIWQWESKNYPELIEYKIRKSEQGVHINGFCEWQNNKVIISARNIGLFCINKTTNSIEWVISKKRNDFNFKHVPSLQHCVSLVDNNTIAIFDNNWEEKSIPIKDLINFNNDEYVKQVRAKRKSRIIFYNLETKESWVYNTNKSASPRLGYVEKITNDIYDIDYGFLFKENAKEIETYSLLEEVNVKENKILWSKEFNDPIHTFNGRF